MNGSRIRLRLTAWYAGSILLLLLAGTVAARTAVRAALEGEFARAQDAAAALVSGVFRAEVLEYRQLEVTLDHIIGELAIPDRHIVFVRPDSTVYTAAAYVRAPRSLGLRAERSKRVAPRDQVAHLSTPMRESSSTRAGWPASARRATNAAATRAPRENEPMPRENEPMPTQTTMPHHPAGTAHVVRDEVSKLPHAREGAATGPVISFGLARGACHPCGLFARGFHGSVTA